ncbi:acetyl-CoA carboxylase biotin carboxyl carrier protein subunit [Novosphingobium sp. FSY-8]|uniref:Biotin carboxyl carrier protein of acetyl-CoA carboxylase n=1 Tax=Novosphingobium ovatum TaxID=1908523 RepID=A0ABW9XDU3_9SPHN|nr:biotin/lipoyl-containing protein [Novosphingobium ovatum]NBC36700.1 acetyl-CoA carboxylase biotin carboxyl carrier protein subunit [Novosphingobium ovatum]
MSETLLTPDDVAEIVAILDGTPYGRIDIATRAFRLRVERDGEAEGAPWHQEWAFADGGAAAAAAPAPAAVVQDVPEGLTGVPAPLPGTFYRAPAPGAAPFVTEGDTVTEETVVGIVETMKLMNPVHAGVAGVVVAILAPNAMMVEAGQPLLHIRAE